MNVSQEILSAITVYMKYAKYIPEFKRRETWEDAVWRNMNMHIEKFKHIEGMEDEIRTAYKPVYAKKILTSMRSLQFAGKPIDVNPTRIYNCFSPDTEFITEHGLRSFNDFKDGDAIKVLTHLGNFKTAVVRSYGKQVLQSIEFHRGKSKKIVKATKNHRWILQDGSETTGLKVGDVIYKTPKVNNFDYDTASPMEKLYWCYGYVFGDGTKIKKNDEYTHSMVRLCGNDATKYLYRFEEMGFLSSTNNSLNGDIFVYTGKYLKTTPSIEKDGLDMIKAFMDGYLSADAEKNRDWYTNNDLCKYKSIQSSGVDHIEFLEKHLEVCGYYITNKEDLTGQITNYGVRPETYRYGITNFIGSRSNTSWSVNSITELYEDEVWCLEVEDDHSFVLHGGIVTGNCAYLPIDDWRAFSEVIFLLLGGTGVGYSVQFHHIDKLPEIRKPLKNKRYLISDSIEGWADAVRALIKAYLIGGPKPIFDFRDIRPKGARLITSGGKAPGHEPLKECLFQIEKILDRKADGDKLTPFEAHLILCHEADAVLAGGIRRAAMISLFSFDDDEMLTCKFGNWWEMNPELARSNNSAVISRNRVEKEEFINLWQKIEASRSGEPGFFFTNDIEWGLNPCAEVSLRPFQFCNLVTINASIVETQDDLNELARSAAFIATLQASYTDFHYLRDVWKKTTEKEALIGVSMTGIASGKLETLSIKEASKVVLEENERVAKIIGINKAARNTVIKPEGTASLVVGTSSGIHDWHSEYYLRRIRVGKNEPIYHYLSENHPELLEDDLFKPKIQAIITIPQKAPEGASIRKNTTAIQMLERVKYFHNNWIKPGHRKGANTNNVSATITIKDHEWEEVGEWLWNNKNSYTALSFLPYDDHTYTQAPFEDTTKEVYEEMIKHLTSIDLSKIIEEDDSTNLKGELACAGGACEII